MNRGICMLKVDFEEYIRVESTKLTTQNARCITIELSFAFVESVTRFISITHSNILEVLINLLNRTSIGYNASTWPRKDVPVEVSPKV